MSSTNNHGFHPSTRVYVRFAGEVSTQTLETLARDLGAELRFEVVAWVGGAWSWVPAKGAFAIEARSQRTIRTNYADIVGSTESRVRISLAKARKSKSGDPTKALGDFLHGDTVLVHPVIYAALRMSTVKSWQSDPTQSVVTAAPQETEVVACVNGRGESFQQVSLIVTAGSFLTTSGLVLASSQDHGN